MQILSLGNFFNPSWDGSLPDEEHIASALEELRHSVHRHQREENPQFIDHPKGGYDFILIAQWDGYPKTLIGNGKELPFLEALKENYKIKWEVGVENTAPPVVYWAFDYQADGQPWHEELVAGADLYLSKRIADSKYPNWQWLSQDFSPSFLGKAPAVEKDIDVLFTGSYLPWATERNETLKAVDEKFNLVIHSVNEWPGFKDQRGPVMDEGLPELYARAKVILSIDHTLEAGYWSDRNAQIMCCGRRPLFRYVPLSETVFRDKVDYFYNVEDCIRKISDNIVSEDGGAYKYAQDNLKVKNRVQDLLTIVRSIL
jgi:hypothetical protein